MRYYWGSDSCRRSPRRQVSPLATCHFPIVPSSNTWYAAASLYPPPQRAALLPGFAILVQARRHTPPKQVRYPTDRQFASGYSPPPPHDDAVTFSYGAVANSDRDFHPASSTPSRAYTKRALPAWTTHSRHIHHQRQWKALKTRHLGPTEPSFIVTNWPELPRNCHAKSGLLTAFSFVELKSQRPTANPFPRLVDEIWKTGPNSI